MKGRLGAVEQTVSRIEEKLDNLGMVSSETFEKRREEVDMKLENHELRIDGLEKRAIKNDNSFMRKLGNSFEKKLVGWIVGVIFSLIIFWVFSSQQQQIPHTPHNEKNKKPQPHPHLEQKKAIMQYSGAPEKWHRQSFE